MPFSPPAGVAKDSKFNVQNSTLSFQLFLQFRAFGFDLGAAGRDALREFAELQGADGIVPFRFPDRDPDVLQFDFLVDRPPGRVVRRNDRLENLAEIGFYRLTVPGVDPVEQQIRDSGADVAFEPRGHRLILRNGDTRKTHGIVDFADVEQPDHGLRENHVFVFGSALEIGLDDRKPRPDQPALAFGPCGALRKRGKLSAVRIERGLHQRELIGVRGRRGCGFGARGFNGLARLTFPDDPAVIFPRSHDQPFCCP